MIEKTMNQKISEALMVLRPKAEFALIGDDYNHLQWFDKEQNKPTWEEIQAEIENPTPKTEPTIADKLASVGLDFEELKAAILGGGN